MADKKSFNFSPVPEKLPSPDELFHSKKNRVKNTQEESVTVRGLKPIPRYKIVKRFAGGFLVFLIALVLVMTNLDRAGIHFYYMLSSSMKSVIPKGSLLVGHETKADKLKTGDIITYTDVDGMSVTHEIVEVVPSYSHGEPGYWTKGTDNRDRDEQIVKYADVRGKVIFHIPYIGYFFMKVKGIN